MKIFLVMGSRVEEKSYRRALIFSGHTTICWGGHDGISERICHEAPDAVLLATAQVSESIKICEDIRGRGCWIPILILSVSAEISDRVSGLDAGADVFMCKPCAFEEVLAQLRAFERRCERGGLSTRGRGQLAFADLTLNPQTREVYRGNRLIRLSPTEFEILLYLLSNATTVLTRDRIKETVWGHGYLENENTLDVFIGYLRRKTEVGGEGRLIHTVRSVGYVLR